MLIGLDLLPERIRIPVHQNHNCIIPLIIIDLQVMAAHAIASLTCLIQPEAVAIQFEALGLLAVAKDLFSGGLAVLLWIKLECFVFVVGFLLLFLLVMKLHLSQVSTLFLLTLLRFHLIL